MNAWTIADCNPLRGSLLLVVVGIAEASFPSIEQVSWLLIVLLLIVLYLLLSVSVLVFVVFVLYDVRMMLLCSCVVLFLCCYDVMIVDLV